MSNNMKNPVPIEVQDFQFKKISTAEIFEPFKLAPNCNNLIVADGRRGLLYIAHNNKLTVYKPKVENVPEIRLDINLPDIATFIALNCDNTYLAIAYNKPSVSIYDAAALSKKNLNLLSEIRISLSEDTARLADLRWNPAVPGMLCTIATDHTIGSFQVKAPAGISITGLEKPQNLEALCVAWSPKGKQLVIGCKNHNIVQLKPDLKVARTITGYSPPMGEIISILWLSNYQFCAAYLDRATQNLTVAIIDAPKGQNTGNYTVFDELMNRIPEGTITPRFFFSHIAEWGVIIAASNDCIETGVIGTTDGGATWTVWQMDSNARAELPIIKTNESYPVGLTIDKSVTNKIYLDAENLAKHPFPVLHIIGTSGHLVSFHIVNLKPDCVNICSPPTEIVNLTLSLEPKTPPVDNSFVVPNRATSTPVVKSDPLAQIELPPAPTIGNLFGASGATVKATPFTLEQPATTFPLNQQINFGAGNAPALNKARSGFAFSSADPKPAPPQVEIKGTLPVQYSNKVQQEVPKNVSLPAAKPGDPLTQVQIQVPETTPVVEIKTTKPKTDKVIAKASSKIAVKDTSVVEKYDESIYLRAYGEELALFEKELKWILEVPSLDIGTEQEKQILVEQTAQVEEGLYEMTNKVSAGLACLKARLLQSFAWVEEAKSRMSSSVAIGAKNRDENTNLDNLENRLYSIQMQITQVNCMLDERWLNEHSKQSTKMKIPNVESLYLTLIKQANIIEKQSGILDAVSKQIKAFGKTNSSISNLNNSMSNLNLSTTSSKVYGNEYGIEMKIKNICEKQQNFSRKKHMMLKDRLMQYVPVPRVIKPVNPSAVQDRLNSTLSSLASFAKTETITETQSLPKVKSQIQIQQNIPHQTVSQQNPLPSINNLISRLESEVTPIQASFQASTPITSTTKGSLFSPVSGQPVSTVYATNSSAFPKLDIINFGGNKLSEQLKDTFVKSNAQTFEPSKSESKSFQNLSTKSLTQESIPSSTNIVTKGTTATVPLASQIPPLKLSDLSTNNIFSSKPVIKTFEPSINLPKATVSSVPSAPSSQPSLQTCISLGSLTGLQQPEFSVASAQTTSAAPMPSPLIFKTPETSLFAKTAPATTSSPSSIASGMVISPAFCRTTTSVPITTSPDIVNSSAPSVTASQPTSTVNQSIFSFGSQPTTITTSTAPIVTATSSIFGGPALITNSNYIFGGTTGSTASPTTTVTATATPPTNLFGALKSPTTKSNATAFSTSTTSPPLTIAKTTTSTNLFSTSSTTSPVAKTTATTAVSSPSTFSFLGTSTLPTSTAAAPAVTSAAPFSGSLFNDMLNNTSALGFGTATSLPTTTSSIFSNTTTTTSNNVFGKATDSTTAGFGALSMGSSSGSSLFGNTASLDPNTTSLFGKTSSNFFGGSTTTTTAPTSLFGATATTASSMFGGGTISTSSPFGAATSTASSSPFGASSPTSFGAATTAASPRFGVTPAAPSSPFGAVAITTSAPFGSPPSTSVISSSKFGAAATTSALNPGSTFGGGAMFSNSFDNSQQTNLFMKPPAAASTNSMFGGTVAPAFGASGQVSMFNDPSKTQGSLFGSSGTGLFGTAAQGAAPMGSSMMGGTTQPVFGQSASFGTTDFGKQSTFAGRFSTSTFGGSAPGTGFGSPPSLGGGLPPQMSSAGNKVFGGGAGSNTFETLANQSGGLSFSGLAQKTSEPPQAPTFPGGSSFSSWR